MLEKHFWDLIGWANANATPGSYAEDTLEEALLDLTPGEIEDFYLLYHRQVMAAWTEDMQLVAFVANCRGDRMIDTDLYVFLCWLIDRGKPHYDAVLTHPDQLADVYDSPDWMSDGYCQAAVLAWESR